MMLNKEILLKNSEILRKEEWSKKTYTTVSLKGSQLPVPDSAQVRGHELGK